MQVEHHELRCRHGELLEPGRGITGDHAVEALTLEGRCERSGQLDVIVDDKDPGHAGSIGQETSHDPHMAPGYSHALLTTLVEL